MEGRLNLEFGVEIFFVVSGGCFGLGKFFGGDREFLGIFIFVFKNRGRKGVFFLGIIFWEFLVMFDY